MVSVLCGLWAWPGTAMANFIQLDIAMDVKTRFSDGCHPVEEVVHLAEQRKLDGLVFGDHDRKSLEYGIFPLERILRKKMEQSSVLANSAVSYLAEIQQNQQRAPEVVLIPGAESAPFYYWTGSLFKRNLVAHNWDKHLLVVGMNTPHDYEELPILNSNFTTRYSRQFLPLFLGFSVLALVGFFLFYKKIYPRLSLTVAFITFLLAVNNHPLRSSPFDQYHGDPGAKPYQELIDYAVSRGALVFWNHLDTSQDTGSGDAMIKTETPAHPEDLIFTRNYTGFQAVDEAPVAAAAPGAEWDQVLLEYLQGQRPRAVWGFGANDFHCETADRKLGGVRTIVLVRNKDRKGVMEALRLGRMYAVKQPHPENQLSLDAFYLSDSQTGQTANLGEELLTGDFPEISLKIRSLAGTDKTAQLKLIRNGEVVRTWNASLPFSLDWRDTEVDRIGPVYYRLEAEAGPDNRLVSNPVFVKFVGGEAETKIAALPPKQPSRSNGEPKASTPKSPSEPQAPATPQNPVGHKEPQKPARPEAAAPSPPPPAPPASPSETPVASLKTPSSPNVPAIPKADVTPAGDRVTVRIDGLTLRKGPSVRFPEAGTLNKGDRLTVVRRTQVVFNGKAWLLVEKDGRRAYVWEGFVTSGP